MEQSFRSVQSEDLILSNLRTKEMQFIIRAEINRMPQRMREIYILSKEEQFTIQEISSVLTVAPQTVKNQLHRALGRIRLTLQEQGFHFFTFFL
jgi:RNA polymerase sigma-70 factor (ECF subfamily)